ncbi:hypothetical protein BDV29DRAFT_158654 [Aspergillus leporis]|uniref:Ankyrin repeat-containing domain protein n=1 Tax=Aspergillus leporis TaxID=41062 RepID=A0A5N5WUU8_9EURO|nr:hypothetical protein BDV29DRAFT_158654 [Aspergillus leporis]
MQKTPEASQVLFDHGLKINGTVNFCSVPLMEVVYKNDPFLLRWFHFKGATPNLAPPDTRESCDLAIVEILIEHGAKLENGLLYHPALCRYKDEECIPMMEHLKRGADINKFGWIEGVHHEGTALTYAAHCSLTEEAGWLLEHGNLATTDPFAVLHGLTTCSVTSNFPPGFRKEYSSSAVCSKSSTEQSTLTHIIVSKTPPVDWSRPCFRSLAPRSDAAP